MALTAVYKIMSTLEIIEQLRQDDCIVTKHSFEDFDAYVVRSTHPSPEYSRIVYSLKSKGIEVSLQDDQMVIIATKETIWID